MKGAFRRAMLALAVSGGLIAPLPAPVFQPAVEASTPSYRVLPEERARRARRQAQPRTTRAAPPPARRTAARTSPRPRIQAAAPAAATAAAPGAAASGASAASAGIIPALTVPLRPARPGARMGPGALPPPAELEAFVDGLVRDAMSVEHIAGVSVSVVGGGQLLLNKGYGFADFQPAARPVDPNRTLFRIGSVSKTFTWMAVMQEVEAGRMRLDAPINSYLPEDAQVPDRRRMRPIQVRDLMTHTPGFEDSALGHLFIRNGEDVRPLLTYLAEERPGRVRPPGVLPTYSNYGVALAGAAVSQVARAPFSDLIERRITNPLGMARTTFREPYPAKDGLPAPLRPDLARDLSEGFEWTGSAFKPRPLEFITQVGPAGSASSTSGDMARYMLALLNDGATLTGGRIYGPRTAQAFRTVLQRSAPGVNGWAHGFMEYSLPGGFTGYGHGGATLSFYTTMVTVPELGLGVFVTTNTDTGRPLVERLPGLVVARFYAPPPAAPLPGSEQLKDRAGDYAGTYLTTRRATGGLEGMASRISGTAEVSVSDDGRLITRSGELVRTWTPDGAPNRFRSSDGDSRLVFEMEDGRAVRWHSPSGAASYDRQSWLQSPTALSLLGNLVLLASLLALGGAVMRARRGGHRSSGAQVRSSALEVAASLLWVVTAVGFTGFALSAGDSANVLYNWPGPWLVGASIAALLASLATVGLVIMLLPAWRSETRGGWTLGRRIRHTITVLLFGANAALLASWGALEPWSG